MKSPAFQFYPADFLIGVMGMTDEEVGIYIKMLALQWEAGSLPNDKKMIKKMINSRKVPSEVVLHKFAISDDGFLRNERLEKERSKQIAFKGKCVESGKKGGNPNFQKGKSNPYYTKKDNQEDNNTVISKDNPNINSSSSSSSSSSKENIYTKEVADAPKDPIPFPDDWSDTPKSNPYPTLEQAVEFGKTIKMTPGAVKFWWEVRESAGWTKSLSGGGHSRKITGWQSDMATSITWAEKGAHDRELTISGKIQTTGKNQKRELKGSDITL